MTSTGAEVLGRQEIDGASRDSVNTALALYYAHSYRIGTVGLWSDYLIERIVVVGVVHAASTDRHFSALTEHLDEPRHDGGLPEFTWQASPFPLGRLDHLLQRGMAVTAN
ncbi:hypothetical protein AAGW05_01145 [Arthrobacter sp. LAPM80]|uniref:hypothetical protein n=1 Tax=Arthrobacter sp. LAPM80 TaxID=3141788 RepID=UPI00398ABCF1